MLPIGDRASDVAMIHSMTMMHSVGDVLYSLFQFRFLLRLLLVHGAWNYSRISKLILYSFYKNICLYVIELWFALYSAW